MNENNKLQSRWTDFTALTISFFGAIVSVGGALFSLLTEARITGSPVWPLPGFVLLDWALIGVIGFLVTFLSIRMDTSKWLRAFWFCTGAFLPLIILGAFSIGPFALIVFLLFLISAILLLIRRGSKWLESVGFLIIGAICNLGLLLIIISLGNLSY